MRALSFDKNFNTIKIKLFSLIVTPYLITWFACKLPEPYVPSVSCIPYGAYHRN